MSTLVVESEVVELLCSYLDQLRITHYRYEFDGDRVSLQTKRYDSTNGGPRSRAAQAPWSVGKAGAVSEVAGGYLKLRFAGERDVFFQKNEKSIVRPTRYDLRVGVGGAGSARGQWADTLDVLQRSFRYIFQTFEGRDVRFALDADVAARLFSSEGKQKTVTVSSNAGVKLRLEFLPQSDTLLLNVIDPASPTIWDGEGHRGARLVLWLYGATVDDALARKLKKHRRILRPDDLK